MKLLVVDDEEYTREGLCRFIRKKFADLEEVLSASNAEDGYEIFCRVQPDIILSDIVMPGQNGIEFVKRCCAVSNSFKLIMISGFNEAEYLKSAIALSAVDYIFKPVNIHELEQVLAKAVSQIQRERTERENVEALRQKLNESMPLLRDRFLMALLGGEITDPKQIKEQLNFLSLPDITEKPCCVACYATDPPSQESAGSLITQYQAQSRLFDAFSVIKGVFAPEMTIAFMPSAKEVTVICATDLPLEKDFYMDMEARSRQALDLSRERGVSLSAGIGAMTNLEYGLDRSYRQALSALNQRFQFGYGCVVQYKDLYFDGEGSFAIPSGILRDIIRFVFTRDITELRKSADAIFVPLYSRRGMSEAQMQNVRLACVEAMVRVINETNITGGAQKMNTRNIQWNEILEIDTINGIKSWMTEKLEMIAEYLFAAKTKNFSAITQKLCDLVEKRYAEPINLQTLADVLGLSPNYVSAIFKQEMKTNFTEYLTEIRIKKARELFDGSSLKVYEICSMVGYSDQNYFAKIFKKYYGVSPSEYRGRVSE